MGVWRRLEECGKAKRGKREKVRRKREKQAMAKTEEKQRIQ